MDAIMRQTYACVHSIFAANFAAQDAHLALLSRQTPPLCLAVARRHPPTDTDMPSTDTQLLACPCGSLVAPSPRAPTDRCQACHRHLLQVSSARFLPKTYCPEGLDTEHIARKFRHVGSEHTVGSKLAALSQAFDAISTAAGPDVFIEADDLIPVVCYVLLETKLPKLYSEMALLEELIDDDDRRSQSGCCVANLQAAVLLLGRIGAEATPTDADQDNDHDVMAHDDQSRPVSPVTEPTEKTTV